MFFTNFEKDKYIPNFYKIIREQNIMKNDDDYSVNNDYDLFYEVCKFLTKDEILQIGI